ncbi:hypothetical protein D9758_006889 [Tetrapyrgos nigripes]|uniref:Major facilitator superfamily (MFS) profile domain-containing protein n=1 Tax=Tetrapyrgos nigripes TaxID=182062 RepID=A0A8H5GS88_9AGAR|nr:hypothetical protein D9758_006889 [Tetrapyrgos nigripes]
MSASATAISRDSGTLLVDWDGPEDPENPRNWAYRRKWSQTLITSAFTFVSPLSSSMIAPAAVQMAGDLDIRGSFLIALSVSIYVLAYAVGPLFLGPLSEVFGRAIVLTLANGVFFAFNLACGFAQTNTQLFVFRFLAGIGASAPLAIGGGILGDMWLPKERGKAAALFSLAPLLGPAIGPIVGGWVAEKSTWRWVFYATTIADGVVQFLGFFFLKETYVPVLLARKAEDIKKKMNVEMIGEEQFYIDPESGQKYQIIKTQFQTPEREWRPYLVRSLGRPFYLFFHEPILIALGIYMAYIYGMLYLFLTTVPAVYTDIYHFSDGIAGLHYIALGIGISTASQTNARTLDRVYRYLTKRYGGVGRPEFRMPPMVIGSILLPIGLLLFGWAADQRVFWFVTDIGLALTGAGIILNFQSIQTYLLDSFTPVAASAYAAMACCRSLAGFGFPLFAPAMFNALGYGKGNTILASFALAVGCPAPWLFWNFGERLRAASRHATKTKRGAEKESLTGNSEKNEAEKNTSSK